MMSIWSLIRRSLLHYWRIHLAVALGVTVATTVLTGAFVVGDSVRASLRQLALDRLQRIDFVLVGDQYFRGQLVDELQQAAGFAEDFTAASGLVLVPRTTVESFGRDVTTRASDVTLLGTNEAFWDFGRRVRPQRLPEDDEIVVNENLADELGVDVGDQVVIRLPTANEVPADSPLGRKEDIVRSVTGLRVIEVLPAAELGQFRLRTSQQSARNAFVSLAFLQDALDEPGRVNAIVVQARNEAVAIAEESTAELQRLLRPRLADRGIQWQRIVQRFPAEDAAEGTAAEGTAATSRARTIVDQYQLTTNRLIFDRDTARVMRESLASRGVAELFTYLVNTIAPVETNAPLAEAPSGEAAEEREVREIPYSMVTAVDEAMWSHLTTGSSVPPTMLANNEIALNQWAANDLGVSVGDQVRLTYFDPETTHGETRESAAEFVVRAILPLTEPVAAYESGRGARYEDPPTPANDPDLTPTVEGVTDEETIDDWDPPFPFDRDRVDDPDEAYWDYYRTTPKAFVSLTAGRQMWGSRFGETTALRIPAEAVSDAEVLRDELEAALANDARTAFSFRAVRRDALRAASGTTPFEALFLGFSMFLIASALMLVALLFRLGVEMRAREAGLLRAIGWELRRVRAAWLAEAVAVASVGAAVGTACGVGYAWLMLAGLRTWWLAAVVTPFLQLHVTVLALALGFCCGVAACLLVLAGTVRRLRRASPRTQLAGQFTAVETAAATRRRRRWTGWAVAGLFVVAAMLAGLALRLQGEAQAGAFFGSGAAALAGGIGFLVRWLRHSGLQARSQSRLGVVGLATRAAARNPTRSALTMGLMATACFLIVAISAFRIAPTEEGTGGFNLMATADRPLFADVQTELREALRQTAQANGEVRADVDVAQVAVWPLRVREGDDASCRNLYRPAQPRVLGIPRAVAMEPGYQGTFRWAATAAQLPSRAAQEASPWELLWSADDPDASDPIPVVIDKNTAMYSLQLYGGIGEEFTVEFEAGEPVRFRVVGLLANSILQGNLIIAADRLVTVFPDNEGYRFLLVRTPPAYQTGARRWLEDRFGDQGLDVQASRRVLADFLAVQNTYLSTFQSLGALGLVLGMLGVAVVQTRNVLERRGELALLRAVGFARRRIGGMVLWENISLLGIGLTVGLAAALIAVVPHFLAGGAAVPWWSLAWMLGVIILVGTVAGLLTVRVAMQAPIVTTLRED